MWLMYFVNFGGCKSDTSFYFYVSTFAKYMVITMYILFCSSIFAEHILSHPFIVLRRQCQASIV